MKWWGPKDFTSPTAKINLREGGKYHFCMQTPDGVKLWSTGVYKEILPLKKLVWTDSFADENGNVVAGDVYGMPGLPMEFLVTLDFEEVDGKTNMTLTHEGLPEGDMETQTVAGWNESIDKLASSLN